MALTTRGTTHLGALALAAVLVAGCGGSSNKKPAAADRPSCPAVTNTLPGMHTGEAPWPPELIHLGERLDELGLPRLTQEGQVMDLHVQLSVTVDGTKVTVPVSIGLNGEEVNGGRMVSGFVSAIHTHDDTGLIHVHSPDVRTYTLGQVFDIWGVALAADRVGGYCTGSGHTLSVTANGQKVPGDPRDLKLEPDMLISVVYGGG